MNRNEYIDIIISKGLQNLPCDMPLHSKASCFEIGSSLSHSGKLIGIMSDAADHLRGIDKAMLDLKKASDEKNKSRSVLSRVNTLKKTDTENNNNTKRLLSPDVEEARITLQERGYTYEDAAKSLGVTMQHLALVLTCNGRTSESLLKRISELPYLN